MKFGRHDTEQNNTQHSDIQHNNVQHNDVQQNNKLNMTLSIMAEHFYAEGYLCWVSLLLSFTYESFKLTVVMLNGLYDNTYYDFPLVTLLMLFIYSYK